MRFSVPCFMSVWLLAGVVLAQPKGGSEEEIPNIEVMPLINANAPEMAVWFVADPQVARVDAGAIESQVYDDFNKRSDVRLLSREKTSAIMSQEALRPLSACQGDDTCLIEIGKALKVQRIVGVVMKGGIGNYRLLLTRYDLDRTPPARLNSVVEGSLNELLTGRASDGVAALQENTPQPIPELPPRPAPPPPLPKKTAATEASNPPVTRIETRPEVPEALAGESRGFFQRHVGSTLALGAGLASGAVGIVLGVLSKGIESEMTGNLSNHQWDPDRDQTGRNYALGANILFGVAGAAAITSIVLFFLEPGADECGRVTVSPALTGVQAQVKF